MNSVKANKGFEIKASNSHTMFLPAFIDDYGFNPEEFRVFGRIMRRSLGSDESCYESIPNLAKALFISERLIRRALNVLEACGAITRTVRSGKSDVYDFNPASKWKPSSELLAIRRRIDAKIKRKDRVRKEAKLSGVVAFPQGETPVVSATTPLAETQSPVVAETQDEGNPIEGYPKKEQKERAEINFKPPADSQKTSAASVKTNSQKKALSKTGIVSQENDDDYYARKQKEYPHIDIFKLAERCHTVRAEKGLKFTRAAFDNWCEREQPAMTLPVKSRRAAADPARNTVEAEKLLSKKYGGVSK